MPNWVMNQLTCIFQTSEEYNAFKEKANIKEFYNSFLITMKRMTPSTPPWKKSHPMEMIGIKQSLYKHLRINKHTSKQVITTGINGV